MQIASFRFLFFFAVFLGVLLLPVWSAAQVYENVWRAPQERLTLETPHFRIVFTAGHEEAARRTGRILEDQYDAIQSLVGGSLRRFPVVLNDLNDLSNGYVTPLHFRSEIELAPFKGSSISPRTGGWLENVAPHELVHALHFSNIPRFGLSRLLYLFWPDSGRMVHGWAPFGMIEGIAVFHESNVVYGEGGRGNDPVFRNQLLSAMSSGTGWSLAQHLNPAFISFPGGRHYIGGYEFISWMQYEFGMDVTRETIERFSRFPLMGYGRTLRQTTGMSTSALFRAYTEDLANELPDPVNAQSQFDSAVFAPAFARDEQHGRPVWINDDELLVYMSLQYNRRPGFYIYEADLSSHKLLFETRQTSDFGFQYHTSSNRIFYARYHTHPWHVNRHEADLHAYNLSDGRNERITRGKRVHAPAPITNNTDSDACVEMFALQTVSETNQLKRIPCDGEPETIHSVYPDTFVQLQASPTDPDTFAAVLNRNGVQALWLIRDRRFDLDLERNPDIGFRNGSVLDFQWTADGKRLVLAATINSGLASQIYLYDIQENQLTQLTDLPFGAWMGSLSPNRERLAFIAQRDKSQRVAVLDKEQFVNRSFVEAEYQPDLMNRMQRARLADYRENESLDWTIKPYRTGFGWLVPRAVLPVAEDYGFRNWLYGLSFEGGDLMRRHAWQATLSYGENRIWPEFSYRNTTFYPGYQVSAYNRPFNTNIGLAEERGGSFSLPFSGRIDHRSRNSFWELQPGIKMREIRLIDTVPGQLTNIDNWFTNVSLTGFAAYYHRLQQNRRDIVPNRGSIIFTQSERYIYSDAGSGISAFSAGFRQYLSPWIRANHGFITELRVIRQSQTRLFGTGNLIYPGFSENPLTGVQHAAAINMSYILPLWQIDDGFISVPVFFDRIYLRMHAGYAADIDEINGSIADAAQAFRSVYGAELRTQFRFFNLPFDLGFGIGYEPTRNRWQAFGNF
ncbi:MAG: hypothetical protein LAT67_14905 [Balneolales bacterium]|nr:hypothetical protein [Balneolales bacterium]